MKEPHLGQPVIYQQTDGQGGMIYYFAVIVKLLPGTGAVNLKIFGDSHNAVDRNYDGIFPVDVNDITPVRMQSNRWNKIESQF